MTKAKTIGIVLSGLLLATCMPFQGTVKPNVATKNEIVITPELKAILAVNPRPKIVIRVPNPPTNVTEADRFNTYINIIEKTFLQQGFVVRDRALLENLMQSGNIDYQGIQKTIDTDLIIDILSLEFNIPNPVTWFFNQTTQRLEAFATTANYIDCPKAQLECRVTIIAKGQLGGLFTFFASRCDQEDIIFLVQKSRAQMMWPKTLNPAWLPALSVPIESEELRRIYTQNLATQLINQLVERLAEALGLEARVDG